MGGGAGEWESLENGSRWRIEGAEEWETGEWESLENYGKCIENCMVTRLM
jgi:hypothetical protein